MRLPRFRGRTLVAVVGLAAVLTWGAMMGARSYDYYDRAQTYGAHERGWREIAGRNRLWARCGSRCADYYSLLARTYRRTMWYPWMPVASDPSAPGFPPPENPWPKDPAQKIVPTTG